jgi:hypothetical protein
VNESESEVQAREANVVDGDLRCPECGGAEFSMLEEVTTRRRLVERRGDTFIFELDSEVWWEETSGERLMCETCHTELEAPEGFTLEVYTGEEKAP